MKCSIPFRSVYGCPAMDGAHLVGSLQMQVPSAFLAYPDSGVGPRHVCFNKDLQRF